MYELCRIYVSPMGALQRKSVYNELEKNIHIFRALTSILLRISSCFATALLPGSGKSFVRG